MRMAEWNANPSGGAAERTSCSRREFLQATSVALFATQAGLDGGTASAAHAKPDGDRFTPVQIPAWVRRVSTMAFGSAGDLQAMAEAGVQVLHTNMVWPYWPLERDGGGLKPDDAARLDELVGACRKHGVRLSLGLPPFPPVELVREHPEWRIHPDREGSVLKLEPVEDNLGTRIGCNLGPWGAYLIDVCAELVEHHGVDGFSFDGNYHPPICYCPACDEAYRADRDRPLPERVNLDDVEYRRYLVWRGARLEDHYRRMQERIKGANPDAVLMSWTVNAGRYGHFLHSPRAMPTRLNRLFDLPMQEWWLDETNLGASVAPAFGAAYLSATVGAGRCASEPYLMSRGNPYGTHSFPRHERLARTMLAVTHGNVTAQSFGWAGHRESASECCREVGRRAPWILDAEPLRWAAMLVSEQTRQFYAYRNIAELFLPHVFGGFRAALEEHLPLRLINDWDVATGELSRYRVLVLPNAAALSDSQVAAVREFVSHGGGLVATGETSLCDELGQPRGDFGLVDVFGVSFRGRPQAAAGRAELDENFARHLDENYWNQRVGLATLSWDSHELVDDERLNELVPGKSVIFKGPQVLVSEPGNPAEVAARLQPDGAGAAVSPAVVARSFGEGRVVYLAAALDAALWSYSYPYQRRLLARAIEWAAAKQPEIEVVAPMCVQAAFYQQQQEGRTRTLIHLFNNINTSGQHGLPAAEVPLREETVPIGGMRLIFSGEPPRMCRWEPDGVELAIKAVSANPARFEVELPALALHNLVVAEF
jgi:hypothetical protein